VYVVRELHLDTWLVVDAPRATALALMRSWPQTVTTFRHARGCLLLYPKQLMQVSYRYQFDVTNSAPHCNAPDVAVE
jgi:hypothetical protein